MGLSRVWDFFAALRRHVQLGSPTVAPEVQAARLAVCRANTCGHFQTWPVERCGDCGCVLSLKTEWAEHACPVGLWPATVDDRGLPLVPPGVPPPPCGGCPGAG